MTYSQREFKSRWSHQRNVSSLWLRVGWEPVVYVFGLCFRSCRNVFRDSS